MKISEIIKDELLERYQRRRPVAIRAAQRPIVRPLVARVLPKPQPKPAIAPAKPVKKSMVSKSQTTGLNPKIDRMNGPNFKLDDKNVLPKNSD